jgi:hypothetical protein
MIKIFLAAILLTGAICQAQVSEETKDSKETNSAPAEIVAGPVCKKGDVKDCARVLKEKNDSSEFRGLYDQVCTDNKSFKCVKITVRGEPKEELKYQKTLNPKAYMFLTKDGGEDRIYTLDRKADKK